MNARIFKERIKLKKNTSLTKFKIYIPFTPKQLTTTKPPGHRIEVHDS